MKEHEDVYMTVV